jgi:hypothetical protein
VHFGKRSRRPLSGRRRALVRRRRPADAVPTPDLDRSAAGTGDHVNCYFAHGDGVRVRIWHPRTKLGDGPWSSPAQAGTLTASLSRRSSIGTGSLRSMLCSLIRISAQACKPSATSTGKAGGPRVFRARPNNRTSRLLSRDVRCDHEGLSCLQEYRAPAVGQDCRRFSQRCLSSSAGAIRVAQWPLRDSKRLRAVTERDEWREWQRTSLLSLQCFGLSPRWRRATPMRMLKVSMHKRLG